MASEGGTPPPPPDRLPQPAARVGLAATQDASAVPAERRPAAPPLTSPNVRRRGERARWPALTLDQIWLLAVLALTFAAANGFPVDQTDYWWTVKLGDGLWATGQLPAADPLAFTSTRAPYVEQQWLAQLILAAVHRLGDLEGALVLRAGLLVVAMGLLFHICRRVGASGALAGAAVGLALLLTLPGAATRPQLFAIPLFALFLAGTTVWVDRAWVLVALPLAMAVWTNVHGSFPLGPALVALALAGRAWEVRRGPAPLRDARLRRLTLLLALCGGAILINPYGVGLLPWLVDFLTLHTGGKDAAVVATEWAPTSLGARAGAYYFASVLLLVVVLIRVGPPPPAHGLRLLAFGLLGLAAVRNTPWWGLVQAPALAWGWSQLGRPVGPSAAPPALCAALVGALLFAAVASLPAVRAALVGTGGEVADTSQPRRAADYLAAYPQPLRLFNNLDWGGYLAWRLAPTAQIFVDGRFGIYPAAVYRDYFRVSAAQPGWEERLEAYGVDALVVSRLAQRELMRALAQQQEWRAVYCDSQAIVYLRQSQAAGREASCEPGG